MKTALTIAGSDSSAGAGIQQDLKVFSAYGVHGVSVLTAVTAQNTAGVQEIEILPRNIISEQIDSILNDIKIDAVKTGMLCTPEIIDLIYKKLKEYKTKNLIVDPVMVSTSDTRLLKLNPDSLKNLRKLIKFSKLTTPNVCEAEILSGIKIKNHRDMKTAAKEIGNCIITGGDFNNTEIYDLLFFDDEFHTFKNKKINARIHGTGCAFSAAITANLSKGMDVLTAVKKAEKFTTDLINHNLSIGKGNMNVLNPTANLNRNSEKFSVTKNIQKAVKKLISDENSYKLCPQVGINIAMSLSGAEKLKHVAGISGRIVRNENQLIPVGDIKFGGSSHIGRVVLTAMKYAPEKRAAMNIKFSDDILKSCKKLDLKIASFERDSQPKDTKTMEWGTRTAIEISDFFPDIIYDRGGIGKEAMIRILGNGALDVANFALEIGKLL